MKYLQQPFLLHFQATAVVHQVEQSFDSSISPVLACLQEKSRDGQAIFTAEISAGIVNMWRTTMRMEDKQHLWKHMESSLHAHLQKYLGTMYVTNINL